MEADNQYEKAIADLKVEIEKQLLERLKMNLPERDNKALKKKLKKYHVDNNDSKQAALEKVNKLLDEVSKFYETAGKQKGKLNTFKQKVDEVQQERDKANKQKVMFENLFNNFKKRYDDQIKKAQEIEKEQENKRKAVIEELQERIKVVQAKYEETGKIKIQKYKENQTLKHEVSKYEPHLTAAESLAEAQLKKKNIEIEIQMTTLKQKIDMMENFKNMRTETEEKLKKSKEFEEKLNLRLETLSKKEQQHKLCLAKAHLVFEDYKKAFNVLKETLPKKEKEALMAREKVRKSAQSLEEIRKKLANMDKQYQKEVNSLQVLLNLQKQLKNQLGE